MRLRGGSRCEREREQQRLNERGVDTRHKAGSGSGPRNHADFIWSVADLLRGDYKQSEYGKVILPLTVLRRLDGVLAPTKQQVLEKHRQSERPDVDLDGDGRGDLAVNPLKS
jgi:type I restriction-modification system DNA methylase subunit